MNTKKLFIKCLVLFGTILFVAGCGNPGAAPAPPFEIPSVLKFVGTEGLSVDVSSISSSGASPNISKTILPPDSSRFIQFGPDLFNAFNSEIFKAAITGIQEIEIETKDSEGNPTKRFKADDFEFSAATGILAGTHDIRIDFADYSFNNVAKEGCSGTAADLPVCVRFWLDGKPFLAGVFEAYPIYDKNNPDVLTKLGKGKFKILIPDLSGFVSEFAYSYEGLENTSDKDVFYLFNLEKGDNPADRPALLSKIDSWVGNVALTQVIAHEKPKKSLNINTQINGTFNNLVELDQKYVGIFVEGEDLWGGNILLDVVDDLDEPSLNYPLIEDDICARISTGKKLSDAEKILCNNVAGYNIRADGVPYVKEFNDVKAAAKFPEEFPDSPGF